MKKLLQIQKELKVQKSQFNNFGKYKYRSCEDIVEAVKPIAHKLDCVLVLSDEIVNLGDRFYIKATASLLDVGNTDKISVSAFARESLTKKGMDDSQITGTASSYARKYALNGLFAIDDTKDSDTNESKNNEKRAVKPILATPLQLETMFKLIGADQDLEKRVLSHYKANEFKELTLDQASQWIAGKQK